ncbi:DUF4286 family protein [Roseibium suaedae]|uniref:Uncharacterized protein n=1 Tax=Roseibium suaedae TaxID=735517 RepID=A0A1M7BGX6_9HYPH|nr:DUF4286 family protein [Roseibium suaedae]SHL54197.1 hypothetical protein SAMN05444272_0833 [Roseibium suaedae]
MKTAFLALWNDYPVSLEEEYETWHTFEHVPERLTTPGILSARRYRSSPRDGRNHYFTLYELGSFQAIDNPVYFDLVKNPTDWSARMREHFSHVLRIPAQPLKSAGRGMGRHALIQAYTVGRMQVDAISARLEQSLEAQRMSGRILGYTIGDGEPNQAYEVFAQEQQSGGDIVNLVVLVEGLTQDNLEQIQTSLGPIWQSLSTAQCLRDDLFEFLASFEEREVPAERTALAASPALRARF